MSCSIMKIPFGFKIRKKIDCDIFINKCMCKGNIYSVIVKWDNEDVQCVMNKDKDENVSLSIRWCDFTDPFNPLLEVARTKDNCYDKTVQDYIWQFRKAINKQWFNERNDY